MKYIKTYEENKVIIKLNYFDNHLSELPELPDTLKELNCNFNNLIELPELPTLSIPTINIQQMAKTTGLNKVMANAIDRKTQAFEQGILFDTAVQQFKT